MCWLMNKIIGIWAKVVVKSSSSKVVYVLFMYECDPIK